MKCLCITYAALIFLCFIFSLSCDAKADLSPAQRHVIKNWLATDRYGHSIGYDFRQWALATQDGGEFKVMFGGDARDPNTIINGYVTFKATWDDEELLRYVMGDDYIPPCMADANEMADRWINE